MTNENKKMIPLSVVDALISKMKETPWKDDMIAFAVVDAMEKIKKETIPIPTQPLIPMSVVDVRIKEYEEMKSEVLIRYNNYTDREYSARKLTRLDGMIDTLERIKKEAIPVQEQGQPLEPLSCPFPKANTGETCDEKYEEPDDFIKHIASGDAHAWYGMMEMVAIMLIEKQSGTKPLEQRILNRITELENMWFTGPNVMKDIEYRDVKIDELRKLLSPSTVEE